MLSPYMHLALHVACLYQQSASLVHHIRYDVNAVIFASCAPIGHILHRICILRDKNISLHITALAPRSLEAEKPQGPECLTRASFKALKP